MSKKQLIVIGIDGATWSLLAPWIGAGQLPNFSALVQRGTTADLCSTIPPATLPAWPSFMTGKNPGKHGVFDFMKREANSAKSRLVNFRDVDGQTAWQILSQAGKRSIVMNVPATFPAEELKGIIIPSDLTLELEMRVDLDDEQKLLEEINFLTENEIETMFSLMFDHNWDLFVSVFRASDVLQHKFWHQKEIILNYYKKIDQALGRIREKLPEANIIIMSDHGFGELRKDVFVNKYLHEQGFIKLKSTGSGKAVKGTSNFRISRERVRYWLEKLGLTALIGLLPRGLRKRLPASDLEINFEQSQAYFSSFFTAETQSITLNIKDRGSVEYHQLREQVIQKLKELKDPATGEVIVEEIFKSEDVYQGPHIAQAPDLLMLIKEGYKITGSFLKNKVVNPLKRPAGVHRLMGIFIVQGPDFFPQGRLNDINLVDLAPTILDFFSVAVPNDMDGKIIGGIK